MVRKTLLITGVSSGLGRALAIAALTDGHTVVGTVRTAADAAAFEALSRGAAFARLLDVGDDDAAARVVDEVERTVGAIDVFVNNAGYGHEGLVEESSMADLRRQFDVNVFGAVALFKAVLPHMRARRAGRIIAISSMGGLISFPGLAFYHGSKFALEGIVASLRKEVAPLGIRVTAVEPGSFRTEWAGRSLVRTPRSIPDYDALFDPLRANRQKASGIQLGDPDKAARAILEIIAAPDPPAHLVLGSDALRLIAAERRAFDDEVRTWEALSRSTDFPDGAQIA
ncbi:MAG: oxidoreductase [Acidobacteriota bacterium]